MTSRLIDPVSLPRLNTPTLRRLPNGLTIVAEQMPTEAVNLSLWLNVGSAVEADSINGMAHFLEHMIFKGTDSLKSGEFERLIEQRGAVTNAATSQDYTHYYITTAPKDFTEGGGHRCKSRLCSMQRFTMRLLSESVQSFLKRFVGQMTTQTVGCFITLWIWPLRNCLTVAMFWALKR